MPPLPDYPNPFGESPLEELLRCQKEVRASLKALLAAERRYAESRRPVPPSWYDTTIKAVPGPERVQDGDWEWPPWPPSRSQPGGLS